MGLGLSVIDEGCSMQFRVREKPIWAHKPLGAAELKSSV